MTLEEFQQSLSTDAPPTGLSLPLEALWYAGQKNWEQAHELAQRDNDSESAWVHAYLHRQEGDLANAGYWYTRAGRTTPASLRLSEEWEQIAVVLLDKRA